MRQRVLRWPSTPGPATEQADAVAAAIRADGGCAFAVTANVTDPSAVRRMFDTVAAHGRLRVLVNNASYRPRQRVETITEEDWHQVRSVTLDGAFRCIRHALPALIPGGRIVNILGRNALAGDPERVHLSAAKHGLLGLTVALAAALRDDGVAVNAVSPGVGLPTAPSLTGAAAKSLLRLRVSPSRTPPSCPGRWCGSTATAPRWSALLRRGEFEHRVDVAGAP